MVLTGARRIIRTGATFAQRRMLVTLEIPSKDRSYPWFLEWMALHAPQHPPSSALPPVAATGQGRIAGLRAMLSGKAPLSLRSHELAVETAFKQHENGSSEAVFNLVPGPGTHYFRYKNAWFQVSRPLTSYILPLWLWTLQTHLCNSPNNSSSVGLCHCESCRDGSRPTS